MIKFIAVCVLVMSLTLQACDKGCLKCNTKNECILCDTSNNYYLSGVNCALSTLTNCLVLNLNGECAQCGANYYLDASTKKCVAVETAKQVTNCSLYGTGQVCIKCAKNFYIKDSKCAAVIKLVDNCETYVDDGKCIGCSVGFIFNAARDGCVAIPNTAGCSAYSFIDCKTCATGYVQNMNLYFLDYQTNSSSIYAEVRRFITGASNDWTGLSRCQKYLDINCLIASAFNVCTTCKPRFYLTADKQCRAYPNDIIEACLTYNSLITCSSCQSGYFLENSKKCTLISGDKLITDCVTYDNKASNVQCVLCSTTKFLSANTCSSLRVDSLNIVNCKTVSVASDTCAVCNDGFILTTDSKKCIASIPNCIEYNTSSSTSTSLTCKTCALSYYLNTVDSVTTCVAGGIEGCLTYSSSTVCTGCNTVQYYLKDAKCTKHIQSDNCVTYNGSNFNECVTCANGFYPFKYSFTCLAITVITNCIAYTDDTTCATCAVGFFIKDNKCQSITGTFPNCATAIVNAVSCGTCIEKYALKNIPADLTCTPNHNYILDFCDTAGAGITLKANDAIDNTSCTVCKENAFPLNIGGLYSCILDGLIATRGVTAPVTGCKKYGSGATPLCQQCPVYLSIPLAGARTCVTTCDSTLSTNLLDDYEGNINTCALISEATNFKLADCAIAVRIVDTTFVLSCIKPIGTRLATTVLNVDVLDNATIWKDVSGSSVTQPDDAFLYNGFPITASAAADPNGHDPADTNCELYYLKAAGEKMYCARCKFGFTVRFKNTTAAVAWPGTTFISYCDSIPLCITSVKYGGFRSSINRFLSCHACSGTNNFVVLSMGIKTDAATSFDIFNFVHERPAVSCQTPITVGTSYAAPTAVANCLVYGYMANNNTPGSTPAQSTNAIGCIACKPGYAPGTAANFFQTTCTLIADCDVTKNSMVNGCTYCTQTTTGGVAAYKAFSDYKGQVCRANISDNCFIDDNVVVSGKYGCKICRPGLTANSDKICEKITLPQCSDASGATNLYKLPATPSTAVGWGAAIYEYLALKLLSKANSILGCETCASGFTGFMLPANEKQCTASPYVASNLFLATTPISYVTDCSKYNNNLGGAGPVATCKLCKNNKIPTLDGKKCVTAITKCLIAQNDPNATKCNNCETTHVQVSGACVLKSIANCKTYDETFSVSDLFCTVCNTAYVLATNKKSCYAGKVIGCDSYDLDLPWVCNTCFTGYNKVTTVNSRTYCFKINEGSNCLNLDNTASGLQGGLYKCSSCTANNSAAFLPKAYTTSDVAKVQSVCLSLNLVDKCLTYNSSVATVGSNSLLCTSCSVGFWVDEDKNVCTARVNQPSGCILYETNKDKCKTCSTSTFINETATDCVSFPSGILRCATYSNDTVCTSCNAPAYLNANACPLSTVISKCLTYTANYTCTGCESNYFLTNSTFCEAAKATNCFTLTSINACEKCNPLDLNKGLKTDTNGITSCVDKNVPNCDISTNEFPFRCTQCKKGFFIGTDAACAAATSINKCLIYDSATTCTLCEPLSLLAVDRKSCDDTKLVPYNDINCVDSQIVGSPICSRCNPGSVFVGGLCASCSNNTYTDGCFSCDPTNQASCFACRPGYYQNQVGKCLAIVSGPVTPVPTSSASIVKLFGLLALLVAFLF